MVQFHHLLNSHSDLLLLVLLDQYGYPNHVFILTPSPFLFHKSFNLIKLSIIHQVHSFRLSPVTNQIIMSREATLISSPSGSSDEKLTALKKK